MEMTTTQYEVGFPDDPMWDDLFHGCAWSAFAQLVAETGGVPESDAARRRAYGLYEAELKAKHSQSAD